MRKVKTGPEIGEVEIKEDNRERKNKQLKERYIMKERRKKRER